MTKEEMVDKVSDALYENWKEVDGMTIEEIGKKCFGDVEGFFLAGEAAAICAEKLDGVEKARMVMTIFCGLVHVAYMRGRESVTQ